MFIVANFVVTYQSKCPAQQHPRYMLDSPAERLAGCSETKSGGAITTMTSIIADMNFILVITQIGSHRGEDRKNISLLETKDKLTW